MSSLACTLVMDEYMREVEMRVHVMWLWPADAEAEAFGPPHARPAEDRVNDQAEAPQEEMSLLRLLREIRNYL